MRACNGNAFAHAHQFGQHQGTRNDRDVLRFGGQQFGVVCGNRRRYHQAINPLHMGRLMANKNGDAQASQALHRGAMAAV